MWTVAHYTLVCHRERIWECLECEQWCRVTLRKRAVRSPSCLASIQFHIWRICVFASSLVWRNQTCPVQTPSDIPQIYKPTSIFGMISHIRTPSVSRTSLCSAVTSQCSHIQPCRSFSPVTLTLIDKRSKHAGTGLQWRPRLRFPYTPKFFEIIFFATWLRIKLNKSRPGNF